MSESPTTYKLSDNVIAQVARILQVAIISGTDIVDNLRLVRLQADGEELQLTPEYEETFEDNIQSMLAEVEDAAPEAQPATTEGLTFN